MPCRCAERRTLLAHGLRSIATGHLGAATTAARAVTRSTVEDMMKVLNPKLTPEVKKPEVQVPRPSTQAPKPR